MNLSYLMKVSLKLYITFYIKFQLVYFISRMYMMQNLLKMYTKVQW